MIPNKPWIEINDRDTTRIRKEFGQDPRIHYGFNKKMHRFEAWYVPEMSAPYMITNAENVEHAIKLLRSRAKHDTRRAKDILRDIDEHNAKVGKERKANGMLEVKNQLRQAVAGKRFFGPWSQRKMYRTI